MYLLAPSAQSPACQQVFFKTMFDEARLGAARHPRQTVSSHRCNDDWEDHRRDRNHDGIH